MLAHLNTIEVARIANVTERQLQHWDERKIVSPPHKSHCRLYNASTLFDALMVGRLRSKGLSLRRAESVVKHPNKGWKEQTNYMVILPNSLRFCHHPEMVAHVLNIEDGPGYVINLNELRAIVTKKMHSSPDRSRKGQRAN